MCMALRLVAFNFFELEIKKNINFAIRSPFKGGLRETKGHIVILLDEIKVGWLSSKGLQKSYYYILLKCYHGLLAERDIKNVDVSVMRSKGLAQGDLVTHDPSWWDQRNSKSHS